MNKHDFGLPNAKQEGNCVKSVDVFVGERVLSSLSFSHKSLLNKSDHECVLGVYH